MARDNDVDIIQFRQDSKRVDQTVDVRIAKIRKGKRPFRACKVRRYQYTFLRKMHLDQIVAVRWSEVVKDNLLAAQVDLHFVLEHHIRNGRISAFPDNVLPVACVRDGHRRIVEYLQAADMILVVVAQDHVFHGHVVEPVKFLLQPRRITVAATGAVDHDESLVGHDNVAVRGAGPVDSAKYAVGNLDKPGRFITRFLGGRSRQ